MKPKPTLRYMARFRGKSGYLRVVLRDADGTRRYVTTPLRITAEQLKRLDSEGYIDNPQGAADSLLNAKLREYTAILWEAVRPIMASGEFASIPNEKLAAAVEACREQNNEERYTRLIEHTQAELKDIADFAEKRGVSVVQLSEAEFEELDRKLRAELTPKEYAAVWGLSEWRRDYIETKIKSKLEKK